MSVHCRIRLLGLSGALRRPLQAPGLAAHTDATLMRCDICIELRIFGGCSNSTSNTSTRLDASKDAPAEHWLHGLLCLGDIVDSSVKILWETLSL